MCDTRKASDRTCASAWRAHSIRSAREKEVDSRGRRARKRHVPCATTASVPSCRRLELTTCVPGRGGRTGRWD